MLFRSLANVVPRLFPRLPWPTGTPPLALVADISLGLFLSMNLMSLQLWALLEVAGPLFAILVVQTLVGRGLLAWIVFRLLGRRDDAAVSAPGFFGQAHGTSPRSFIVVPLVGAFFVDIANAITVQTIIGLMGR